MLSPLQGFIGPFFSDTFGVALPNWLHDETWALPAIVALSVWQVGQTMMIFLAGLQEIPNDLMEAAEIDGAGPVRRFFSIAIPMLTPTIYFNVIVGIIASFQVFAAVFIMTKGGPVNATLVYVMYIYQRGIQFLEMGYASAMALILVLIVLALTFVIMKTSDRWVTYDRI
jgi:multiple sugar transport system permease protein